LQNSDFAKGYKGITAFAVERGFTGFGVGKKEDKLGIRASSTCELILDGCEVPEANVIGEVGVGYKVAIETLNTGRIGIGAQMIGVARVPSRRRSRTPRSGSSSASRSGSFRRSNSSWRRPPRSSRPPGSWCTTRRGSRPRGGIHHPGGDGEAVRLPGRGAGHVARGGAVWRLRLHQRVPVEKFYRDAKIGTIYEGTSNMQLNTIAKQLLR